jgi:hypothetical protein
VRADEERLRYLRVADAADQSTAAGTAEGQDAQEVLEAARNAIGSVVFLGVGVAKLAGSGDYNVLAGLHVDAGVGPELIAGNLNFLGEAALAGGRGFGWQSVFLRREFLRRWLAILTDQLGEAAGREDCNG